MPESFDTLLSEIAENAGSAVHPAGSAAARQRGHQRAVRRRVAASVLSVVLLGGVGGLSLVLVSHYSGSPVPITHSGTPTPTAPAPSASASPPVVNGDLHTIVPGAWTSVSQFPSPLNFKANMSQPAIYTADRQWFYSCYGGGNTLEHLGASGYQEMTYKAKATQAFFDGADQVMFFFPSTSAAEHALATIQSDYAHCPEPTTATDGTPITGTVRQTEQLDGSYAWLYTFRNANGSPANPDDIPSDSHEYFVQRGDVVEMVGFGPGVAVDDPSGDLRFLNSLNGDLCTYGGKCPAAANPLTVSIASETGSTSLALGGGWLAVAVTVTNNSDDTARFIMPIVSLGHCTCVNTPAALMPKGEMQESNGLGGWGSTAYNTEGGGMDYLQGVNALQGPAVDLPPGESMSYGYRVRLYPASQQTKLTAPYRLTNGASSIDVTLIHPGINGLPNSQIGTSPAATLPVTVTVN